MQKHLISKIACAILSIMSALNSVGQIKKGENLNSIGVTLPAIWNNSEALFYRLGSPVYPRGNAISYGINIIYSRKLHKNIYGVGGIGYFKQAFKIARPFIYDSPNSFGYSTMRYKYDNAQLQFGLGYQLFISKTLFVKSDVTYNQYFSFRQKYISTSPVPAQVNKKGMMTGTMINLNVSWNKKITNEIYLGVGIIFPFLTTWKDDEIFYKYDYSGDTQKIARDKFSIGTTISGTYNF